MTDYEKRRDEAVDKFLKASAFFENMTFEAVWRNGADWCKREMDSEVAKLREEKFRSVSDMSEFWGDQLAENNELRKEAILNQWICGVMGIVIGFWIGYLLGWFV